MGQEILSIIGSLFIFILVLTFAWGFSRLLGRGYGKTAHGKKIKIQEQIPLGRDQRLVLVNVKGREFLLGVSSAEIHLLAEMEPDTEVFSECLRTGGTGNE